VVGADSLNQTGEEALAQLLVREGLLAPSEMTEARSEVEASGKQLQTVLLEKRFLDRPQLLSALRMQHMGLLHRVLTWQEGEFKFYANDEVSFEEGLEPIEIQSLLLGAAAMEQERQPMPTPATPAAAVAPPAELPSAQVRPAAVSKPLDPDVTLAVGPPPDNVDLSVVFERAPSARPIRVRSGKPGDDTETGDFILLSPTEQQLLSRIDGQRTLEALVDDCGLNWQSVLNTVDKLEAKSLARRQEIPQAESALADTVFRPPSLGEVSLLAEEVQEYRPRRRAPAVNMDAVLAWGGGGLALMALVWVVAAFVNFPGALLLPFPWQEQERAAFEAQQRTALYLKIDRGAKSYFLLEGQFPERLQSLVGKRLLGTHDLKDPEGRPLRYEPSEIRYELAPVAQGERILDLATDEAITGNFLLDPDFYSLDNESMAIPLVLID